MSSSSKPPIHWSHVVLYSEWVMLIVVAIAILWSSQTWRDLLWFAITVLLGGQLAIVSRLTRRVQPAASKPVSEMHVLPTPPPVEQDLLPTDENELDELEDLRWRHSLACDRYDALGQSLTALNIQLQTAIKLWETDQQQAHNFLVVAHQQGITAMQEIRRSIALLQTDAAPPRTDSINPSPPPPSP